MTAIDYRLRRFADASGRLTAKQIADDIEMVSRGANEGVRDAFLILANYIREQYVDQEPPIVEPLHPGGAA